MRIKSYVFCLVMSMVCIHITVGQTIVKDTLYSSILKENRAISILFPKGYEDTDNEKYSVLYLLDGDENLESVAALTNYLNNKKFARLPNLIVVAISNTDRTRDLTPPILTNVHDRTSTYKNAGGLLFFTSFLQDELMPYINNKVTTTGYTILTGHSFGGLAATHIMINYPDMFSAYCIIDPSYWWDNAAVMSALKSFLNSTKCTDKNIFLALANNVVYSIKETVHADHFSAIKTVGEEYLPASKLAHRQWKFKFYEDDEHGTIPIPATYDALKFLFKEIDLPMKSIIKEPKLLEDCYRNLSKQLHFDLVPNRRTYVDLVDFAISRKEDVNAKVLANMGLKIYPNDSYLLNVIKDE